jgi:hypothetical protein
MNLSTADLRNYWTEFHETWWSYRYMFLIDPKVFRFVVKGVKAIFLADRKSKMATTAIHRLTLNTMVKCSNAFFSETTNMIKAKL